MRRLALGLLVPALIAAGLLLPGAACKKRGGVLPGMVRTKERTEAGEGGELISQLGRPDTRAKAARELGRKKIAKAVPALRGYLKDADAEVRLNCVWALGEIGDKKTIPDVRTLLTEEDHRVRAAAAEALGKMPDAGAVLWLGEALRDQVADVRLAAAEALGNIHDEKSAARLTGALHDAKAEVSAAAARSLGKIGKPAISHV
ncbi:MAG: HEAT repeat domain-containing protein, partial [Phycisphaerae bacterium]